jgi:predicted Zn-dependent peptidase
MKHRKYFLVISLFAISLFVIISNVPADAGGQSSPGLAERVIKHTLANGLTVLLVERHQSPIVSINLTFGVGGINEHNGATGLAHLYEHMAFKGTRTLGTKDYAGEQPVLEELERIQRDIEQVRERLQAEGQDESSSPALKQLRRQFTEAQDRAGQFVVGNELAMLYQRHGGVGLNASTGKDITRYTVSLPSNRLPLWAAVESDRMRGPVLREFYKERDVVLEERRLRTDDNPNGLLYEAFAAAAFEAHPYGFPTIGWASDIQSLTPAVTEAFFQTYYGPANAVIAIVGDIHPPDVIALIERTFGKIPAMTAPPRVVTVEPPQRGERRLEVEFDAEPVLLLGYHKPALGHPDDFVFDVMDSILSEGQTSRLYQRLVREKRLATAIDTQTSFPGAQAPNLFVLSAVPLAPHTAREVEDAMTEELERLKAEPVEAAELEKVLNNLDAELLRSLRSNSGLASQLAYFQTVAKDWRYVLTARERIAAVTPADIQRVAAQYLTRSNRTVATLVKPVAPSKKPASLHTSSAATNLVTP